MDAVVHLFVQLRYRLPTYHTRGGAVARERANANRGADQSKASGLRDFVTTHANADLSNDDLLNGASGVKRPDAVGTSSHDALVHRVVSNIETRRF
jgi:hypothetical protein